jgi:predicted PolB exonuclease-like 3'-5' exonuclease
MAYGIPSKFLHNSGDKWDSYTSRYSSDWHCDLLEVLSGYGASARCKLNEVCAIMGFPGKFGVDGSKVASMIDQGRVQEVRDYCETDVLNTYLVYLRYQMHTGNLSVESYNRCIADVISLIETTKVEQPNRGEFLKAWGNACGNEFTI